MNTFKKRISYSILLLAIIALNFVIGNQVDDKSSDSFSLVNLQALQSSAAEMFCDQTNEELCTITLSGGMSGTSKGFLIIR